MFEVSRFGEISFEVSKRIAKYKGARAGHYHIIQPSSFGYLGGVLTTTMIKKDLRGFWLASTNNHKIV